MIKRLQSKALCSHLIPGQLFSMNENGNQRFLSQSNWLESELQQKQLRHLDADTVEVQRQYNKRFVHEVRTALVVAADKHSIGTVTSDNFIKNFRKSLNPGLTPTTYYRFR
eukprot:IDg6603t1